MKSDSAVWAAYITIDLPSSAFSKSDGLKFRSSLNFPHWLCLGMAVQTYPDFSSFDLRRINIVICLTSRRDLPIKWQYYKLLKLIDWYRFNDNVLIFPKTDLVFLKPIKCSSKATRDYFYISMFMTCINPPFSNKDSMLNRTQFCRLRSLLTMYM